MKRSEIARSAGAALLAIAAGLVAAGASAATKTPAKPAASAAGATAACLKVAPIVYRERRLGNGLQVITVENHSSPTVSVQRLRTTSAVATIRPAARASRISSST